MGMNEPERDQYRCNSAYHEAGHAVVAYHCGWWVNEEGVEIDQRQHCGLRCHYHNNTETKVVAVDLAGWLAGHRWDGMGLQFSGENELLSVIEDLREGWEEFHGDDTNAIRFLLDKYPEDTDASLIARYREHANATVELVAQAEIWQAITNVAEALISKGKLSRLEVEELIDWVRPNFTKDDDLQVYARRYIDRFGEEALFQAMLRSDALKDNDDHTAAATWVKVMIAIDQIARSHS